MILSFFSKRDKDLVILVLSIVLAFGFLLGSRGVSVIRLSSYWGNFLFYSYAIFLYIASRILKIVFVNRPEKLLREIVLLEFNKDRLKIYGQAIPALFCLIVFTPAFSAMKSGIPLFNEYSWDRYFIQLDRTIHGVDPWLLLQPIFGSPLVTSLMSMAYHFWVLLLYVFSLFFTFRRSDEVLRQRFFVAYFLCWAIIGVGLAIIFASVGPCFVNPILGMNDFDPLMQYLKQANQSHPVMVLEVQAALLEGYRNGDFGLGRGITAMPSMHVSIALLFVLCLRPISRVAAIAALVFLLVIMIGSVHLGYHYAVDGYLSLLATGTIWKVAGWWCNSGRYHDELVTRRPGQPQPQFGGLGPTV